MAGMIDPSTLSVFGSEPATLGHEDLHVAPERSDWSAPSAEDAPPSSSLGTAASEQIDALVAEFARTRDTGLRERIILMHEGLLRRLAARYHGSLGPVEDVLQVAYIGLIRAIDRFDPRRGVRFITYAVPTILGEIKHYFRDETWIFNAPREIRDLTSNLQKLRSELEQSLGRAPSVAEMAEAAGVGEERLLAAMELHRACCPDSLDIDLYYEDGSRKGLLGECVGAIDPQIPLVEERQVLRWAIGCLDQRLQEIIRLRFFVEMPQTAVARRLGLSQMHVSRLERQALDTMRLLLSDTVRRERPVERSIDRSAEAGKAASSSARPGQRCRRSSPRCKRTGGTG
jgi:RNA polymerase sigma-B factor